MAENTGEALELPDPVARALTLFASITRRLLFWKAAGWLSVFLLGLFTLIALADKWLLLESGPRRALALLVYAATAFLSWRLLRGVLRQQDAADVALALEKCAPNHGLEERLSTTVELAKRQAADISMQGGHAVYPLNSEGISEAMVLWVADETAEMMEDIDVQSLPDRSRTHRALKAGAAVLALAFVLCLIPHLSMPLLYVRAFMPWLNLRRPSNTQIDVLTGSQRVVDGESLQVEARISGVQAAEATLETRDKDGKWQPMRMDRAPLTPGSPLNSATWGLKLGPLHDQLQYRVSANDGQSAIYDIAVLPRPELSGLTITVHFPHYSRLPDQIIESLSGDISVLKGSTVELSLKANTRLNAAVLEFDNDRNLSMTVDEQSANAAFPINHDSNYRVRLRSVEGVSNPDAPLFSIRAMPDLPPQVTVMSPQADETVDVNTVLTLDARAEDDLAVTSMRLVAHAGKSTKPIVIPLQRPAGSEKVWLVSQPWDLAGLFLEGDETVTFRVEALDALGSVGRSDERRLRVESSQKRQDQALLTHLDEAQTHVSAARKLMGGVRQDAADMRRDFRAENVDFQAADRLLLSETLTRISSETRMAAAALEKAAPLVEEGPLKTLLVGLTECLSRHVGTDKTSPLSTLLHAASRARSANAVTIAAGLDVLGTLLPESEKTMSEYHEGLSAAHRFAGASRLESRAVDIRNDQVRIAPILAGAAGWSSTGHATPGLRTEYFKGTNFETLVRRTTETRIDYKNQALPEVGTDNFSIRWKGQVLAPFKGHYTFRAVADDGVRLDVEGKRIIDQWKAQGATAYDGGIDLNEGWHDIVLEFFQGTGDYEINLQRSGPGIGMNPIPAEHLRSQGVPISVERDPRVREAMAKAASEAQVKQAMVRLQTMLDAARVLPPELWRLAQFQPVPDPDGTREGNEWKKEIATQTSVLMDLKTLSPANAMSLLTWSDQTGNWVERYKNVRERYYQAMLAWSRKRASDVYHFAAALHQLQQNAEAANKAFSELTKAAHEPSSPAQEAEMAKADAAVRALAEDLKPEANQIAAQMKEAASDMRRPLNERRAMEALEARAEKMASSTAEKLEQQLNEAQDPQALAKTEQTAPQLQALQQQAAELAQQAERIEKAMALNESLNKEAIDLAAAKDELRAADSPAANANAKADSAKAQTKSPDLAVAELHAAQALKDATQGLQEAAEAAKTAINGAVVAKAEQLAHNPAEAKAEALLDKAAAETMAGKPVDPQTQSAEQKERKQTENDLGKLAAEARDTAAAVNQELGNLAQELNGDAATALRDAAKHIDDSSKALAEEQKTAAAIAASKKKDAGKNENAAQAAAEKKELNAAAADAEAARQEAAQTAERLALDAEAMHDQPAAAPQTPQTAQAAQAASKAKDEARNAADDLARLAAAVNDEVQKNLDPAADALKQAAHDPAVADSAAKEVQAETAAATKDLQRLAEIAAGLTNPDAQRRKQAHDDLAKALEDKNIAANVDAAIKQGDALDKIAGELQAQAAQAAAQQDAADKQQDQGQTNAAADAKAQADAAAASEKALDAARQELAKAEGADPGDKQALQQAMAGRVGALAQDLRNEADHERQTAAHLDQAAGLEQQARENLKQEAGKLGKNLREAGAEAGKLAKSAPSQPLAAPLASAEKSLPQAAASIEAEAGKADSAPLAQLAADLNNQAKNLEKPSGEIAGALGAADENKTQAAQQVGQAASSAAGSEADLANALEHAEHAEQTAGNESQASAGTRDALEAEVRAAIDSLQKNGEVPAAAAGDLAALAQEAKAQDSGAGEKGSQGQPTPGGQASSGQQPGANGQSGEQMRAKAEQMSQMAAQLDRIAQGMQAANASGKSPASANADSGAVPSSQTPAADALADLARAEAASEAGQASEAKALAAEAGQLLEQAAEAARGQATGEQTPGSSEAQKNSSQGKSAQGQGKGQGKGKNGKNGKSGQGGEGAKSVTQSQAQASQPLILPPGLPIDKATWNRLPDSLRRDLLNAAGGRFPAEYEVSIRHYFKNVAADKK